MAPGLSMASQNLVDWASVRRTYAGRVPLAPRIGAGGRVGKVALTQHTRGHDANDPTLVPQQVCSNSHIPCF